jgi:hypothetical protein
MADPSRVDVPGPLAAHVEGAAEVLESVRIRSAAGADAEGHMMPTAFDAGQVLLADSGERSRRCLKTSY